MLVFLLISVVASLAILPILVALHTVHVNVFTPVAVYVGFLVTLPEFHLCPSSFTYTPVLITSPQIEHSVCPVPAFVQVGAFSPFSVYFTVLPSEHAAL